MSELKSMTDEDICKWCKLAIVVDEDFTCEECGRRFAAIALWAWTPVNRDELSE